MNLKSEPRPESFDVSIPDHWEFRKLRFIFEFGRGLPITKANLLDEGIECISYGEIHSKFSFEVDPEKDKLKCVSDSYLTTGKNSLLNEGDFVFADTSEDLDGVGNFSYLNSSSHIFAGYHTVIARLTENYVPRYIAYMLDSKPFRHQIRKRITGVKVFSVTQFLLKDSLGWFAPKDEQQKISNFLDWKTGQIDKLIEKKKQLIEKLDEQRTAVITQAVTKGLNPDAPMRDSSIPWLGEVPEHWKTSSVRNQIGLGNLKIQDGNHGELHPTAQDYVTSGIPFIMANNLSRGCVDLSSCSYLTESRCEQLRIGFAKAGDMLLSHKGTVGQVAIIPSVIDEKYWMLTPQTTYYRWNQNAYSKFYFYYFQSSSVKCQLELMGGKQSTRSYVGLLSQKEIIIPYPPLFEQKDIAVYLDKVSEKIDALINKSNTVVTVLTEYRTALITAATTGKIDVREIEIPTTN